MICEVCKERIKHAANNEKDAAIAQHGKFHSPHEAWAVLKEEVEELCECLDEQETMFHQLDLLWDMIRINSEIGERDLDLIYDFAKSCAEEAVQVMAMVQKWGAGFDERPDSV